MAADAPIPSPGGPNADDPERAAMAGPAEIDSLALLNGQREVVIRHGGECYRLRHTRNDKLILTK